MKNAFKLVPITESISDKIYDMFQEIPYNEPYQDVNVANGLSKDDFRKYCCVLELGSKNIMLDYLVPEITHYVLFCGDYPVGFFSLRQKDLSRLFQHSGHVGYTIRPTERRKGLGTIGLAILTDKAKKLGYDVLFATCDDKNVASQKLLAKVGFSRLPDEDERQKLTKEVYDGMSQYILKLK